MQGQYTAGMTVVLMVMVGLILGSFSHTLDFRLAHSKPLFSPRSRCDMCDQPVGVMGLIPVFGFLMHRGNSVCCQKPIDWIYPCIEGATALLFGVMTWRMGLSWITLFLIVWFLGLLIMGLTDYWTLHVYDSILFPWLAVSGLLCLLNGEWIFGLLGAVTLVGFVMGLSRVVAYFLQKPTMGEGDFYILFGLFLALRSTLTLGIILLGSLTGILLGLLFKKNKLPFVSLMMWGTYVVLLFFPK